MICYGHIVFQWLNFHAGSSLGSVCKAVCVFHVCSCFISNNIIEYKCFVPRGETGIDRVQMETQYLSVISRRYFNLCLDATFLCLFTLIEQTVQLNWIHCHAYHHLYCIGLFVFTRCTLLSHKLASDTHNPLPDLKTLYSNLKLIYNEYKLTGIHKKQQKIFVILLRIIGSMWAIQLNLGLVYLLAKIPSASLFTEHLSALSDISRNDTCYIFIQNTGITWNVNIADN